jgi:hypothetical protein
VKDQVKAGLISLSESSSESSEEEEEEEDSDGELTKFVADSFLKVLPLIKNKDPSIYDKSKRFFPGCALLCLKLLRDYVSYRYLIFLFCFFLFH